MTVTEIKDQVVAKTLGKIEQMKQRDILLPQKLVDRCALCDQLSQEIYDYAVCTLKQIIDRYHLPYDPQILENLLHKELLRLSDAAIEVLFARQMHGRQPAGRLGSATKRTKSLLFATNSMEKIKIQAALSQYTEAVAGRPVWLGSRTAIKPFRFLPAWLSGSCKLVFTSPSKV